MKRKVLLSIVALLLAISLVVIGCTNPSPAPAPASTPSSAPAPASAQAPAEEVIVWKMQTVGPAANPWHYRHQYLADAVSQMSGGKMKIELYPVNEICQAGPDVWDALGTGALEMACVGGDWFAGINPAFHALGYWPGNPPGTGSDWQLIYASLVPDFNEFVQGLFAEGNIYKVGDFSIPSECFQSRVPIRGIQDYKGLKVRSAAMAEALFAKLGCSVTKISAPEIYTSIQLGTIDATELGGYEMNWASGLHEVAPYLIEPIFHTPSGTMQYLASMDAWNNLTPDLQAMLKTAAEASRINFYSQTKKGDLEHRQKMIDYGCEVCTLSHEDMAVILKKAEEVWNEFSQKNEDCARMTEMYKSALSLYGYEVE